MTLTGSRADIINGSVDAAGKVLFVVIDSSEGGVLFGFTYDGRRAYRHDGKVFFTPVQEQGNIFRLTREEAEALGVSLLESSGFYD